MKRSKADAEQTRETILDAAEKLFFSRGVETTSLDRIAAAAGVTRGAIYWHFKDKADLMIALRRRCCLPQEEMMTCAAATGHPDPFGLLETSARDMLSSFEADERLQRMFLILSTQMPGTPEAEAISRANGEMFEILLQLMLIAEANGQLSDRLTPREAAAFLMITMNGLLNEWLRSGRKFSLQTMGRKLLSEQIWLMRRPANDAGDGKAPRDASPESAA